MTYKTQKQSNFSQNSETLNSKFITTLIFNIKIVFLGSSLGHLVTRCHMHFMYDIIAKNTTPLPHCQIVVSKLLPVGMKMCQKRCDSCQDVPLIRPSICKACHSGEDCVHLINRLFIIAMILTIRIVSWLNQETKRWRHNLSCRTLLLRNTGAWGDKYCCSSILSRRLIKID